MKKIVVMSLVSYFISTIFIGIMSVLVLNTLNPVQTVFHGMNWYFTAAGFIAVSGVIILAAIVNALLIHLLIKE